MKTLKLKKRITKSPKKIYRTYMVEETFSELNSKSFVQNFKVLIHHYKKEEQAQKK